MATQVRIGEVLGIIAANLTTVKSTAALGHYPSLRVQTRNLNEGMSASTEALSEIITSLKAALKEDAAVSSEFLDRNNPLCHYRHLAPRIITNLLLITRKLLRDTPPEPALDVYELDKLHGKFEDFCDLATSVRQFTDTVVETSYQLYALDPKYLNFKVLESLASFVMVAPPSLQAPIYSVELENVVQQFVAMSSRDRRSSDFTHASNEQFPQRVKVLCDALHPSFHDNIEGNLNTVFKFCSDFAHIGYVSTLVIGSDAGQVVLGGPGDAFFPRAENFAELKWQLLREATVFYADVFLRALLTFTRRSLNEPSRAPIESSIQSEIDRMLKVFRLTHRILVEPITEGLMGSEVTIRFQCNCGASVEWAPPHHDWDNYCRQCGARFQMHEVPPEIGYVVSADKPGDVTGSSATKIVALPADLRAKLRRIWEIHKESLSEKEGVAFIHITDPENVDENTLEQTIQVLRTPTPEQKATCQLFAWVANAALRSSEDVGIHCNCGTEVPWRSPFQENTLVCPNCGRTIGLMVVSGDPGYIPGVNPDGTHFPMTVHGSRSKPAYLMSVEERQRIAQSWIQNEHKVKNRGKRVD